MLKPIYWKFEALLFEIYANLMKAQPSKCKHSLDGKLIISLTSYKPRFKKLYLTLKTLISQSTRPDFIILWLSKEDYIYLPEKIKNLEKKYNYFVIKTCDDIKSYKKLIPSLYKYPNAYIVTADDDIFYPSRWLEELTKNRTRSSSIIAHRVHAVKFENGEFAPYANWEKSVKNTTDRVLFPTTGAGVMYPPNCLHEDVLNEDLFLELCPTADDIWFFWMAKLKGTDIIHSGYNLNLISWQGSDTGGLAEQNVENQKNDYYIDKLAKKYGPLSLS